MQDDVYKKKLSSLLARHGVELRKSLGQNFLIDPSVCPKIAKALPSGCDVIEIGPGAGALTRALSDSARRVAAVEIDDRMLPILEDSLGGRDNVKLIRGDALKIDFNALIKDSFPDTRGVSAAGNLPYYITTPIIMRLLEERLPIESIVVMVQKEAAQRLCAPECSRECGGVTLAVRYYSEPEILFDVQPDSFYPPPSIVSSVIRLRVKHTPKWEHERLMFSLIRGAFAQRRKTALNSISNTTSYSKSLLADAFRAVGIAENERGERISLDSYRALATFLAQGDLPFGQNN